MSGVLWRMKSPTAKHMKNEVETAMIVEHRVYSQKKGSVPVVPYLRKLPLAKIWGGC